LLAEHFLKKYSQRLGKECRFSPECLLLLDKYPFPGNIRELENCMERAVIMARDEVIFPADLPPQIQMLSQARGMEGFSIPYGISLEEMERDERIILLGEDVEEGGVFRVTEGLVQRFGPNRIMDAPLAESAIVGVAIGAAINGLRPVAEIQFADFIHPAMNQIISEAARIRYRSNGTFGCPIVIRASYGGGIHGGLHHSQSLEALFFHVPGLKIVVPSTPADAKGLVLRRDLIRPRAFAQSLAAALDARVGGDGRAAPRHG